MSENLDNQCEIVSSIQFEKKYFLHDVSFSGFSKVNEIKICKGRIGLHCICTRLVGTTALNQELPEPNQNFC